MMKRMISSALVASAALVALMLPTQDAFARPGAAGPGGRVVSGPAMVRPPGVRPFPHRRGFVGGFYPGGYYGGGAYYDGYGGSQPYAEVTEPASRDIRYTFTNDVPWDWAHRFPPNVVPSDRPYVSSCPVEHVRTTGSNGGEHTVNITRCY